MAVGVINPGALDGVILTFKITEIRKNFVSLFNVEMISLFREI